VEVGLKTEAEPEKCRARAEQGNNVEQTGQETTNVELKTAVELAEQSTTAEPAEPKTTVELAELRTMMSPAERREMENRQFRYDLLGLNRAERGNREFRDSFSDRNKAGRESRDSLLGRDRAG